jgi:hypothetical protein
MPKPASTPATFAQRSAALVFRTWSARKASTHAHPAVLNVPQSAAYALMQSCAIAPSSNNFAACARTFANGAQMNVLPMTWITASAVPRLVGIAPQHAAK